MLNLPEISFPALEARERHENRLGDVCLVRNPPDASAVDSDPLLPVLAQHWKDTTTARSSLPLL
jgi:hypothetical protein